MATNNNRYQDNYYHKQCFEFDQSQESRRLELQSGSNNQQVKSLNYNQEESSSSNQKPLPKAALDTVDSGGRETQTTYTNRYTRQQYQSQSHSTILSPGNTSNSISNSNLAGSAGDYRLDQRQQLTPSGDTDSHRFKTMDSVEGRKNQMSSEQKSRTIDTMSGESKQRLNRDSKTASANKSATLPHSVSSPANGFLDNSVSQRQFASCAGCKEGIKDGQALIALDLHWHVWCFKCSHCQAPLHGEYVAKDGKAYCEKDYQKLFGVSCVYCKRYITGKVLQAGETHHFHPSCARCSKCGDPFVPGEEMYLQGEVTWHPRCGPGPDSERGLDELAMLNMDPPSRSQSRSASPFSYISRQYDRASPYADSEAVGDLSRVYTISYLNNDPTQGYLRRPIEPPVPKSPQFSRPASTIRSDRSRSSSRSHSHLASSNANYNYAGSSLRDRSVPRGMYSVLSSMSRGSQVRARSPSMMNEEAIHLAQYPSGQKPNPDAVPKIERDDFPAPPFPYTKQQQQQAKSSSDQQDGPSSPDRIVASEAPRQQQRASRPKSREIIVTDETNDSSMDENPQFRKEEEELSKIANGIGKIFLQTLKEREKLRAWKRANLDPRNASRTPSATRELSSRLRYDNPTNASPSRDMDRPRPWDEEDQATVAGDQSPTRTRSSLGQKTPVAGSKMSSSSTAYGYKVVQSSRSLPRPGYGVTGGPYESNAAAATRQHHASDISFNQQQLFAQTRSSDLLARANGASSQQSEMGNNRVLSSSRNVRPAFGSPMLRRSMPNMAQLNQMHHIYSDEPPKLYPYHLLATSNYRLPPDVDRCHLERHLSNEEFQYIFHCDRLDFYRLPEWKRNELKRRAKLF